MTRNSPGRCNILEILLGNPGVPVQLQGGRSLGPILVLAKSVLVDDSAVASRVEKCGGDPGLGGEVVDMSAWRIKVVTIPTRISTHLENEPPSEVHTPDLLGTVGESPSVRKGRPYNR